MIPFDSQRRLSLKDVWFHHPEMQRRIRKAEADLAEGRTKATRTAAEAQELLDGFKVRRRRPRR